MFAFMGSICCHGKLEDSGTQLEFTMEAQRQHPWLQPVPARVPVEVPISGASTVTRLLPNFPTHFLLPCSAKSVATGSTGSPGRQIHSLRGKKALFQVIPSAKRQGLLHSRLNFFLIPRLVHVQQEQQLQITCTFPGSAPSSPENF